MLIIDAYTSTWDRACSHQPAIRPGMLVGVADEGDAREYYDTVQAWCRAMDTDMPLECWQRDREEAKRQKGDGQRSADAIVANARKDAQAIIAAAEAQAARITRAISDRMLQARKSLESI